MYWKNSCPQENECGKYGYVGNDGNWVIEPIFDEAYDFKKGFAEVTLDGKSGFIKPDGTYLVEP